MVVSNPNLIFYVCVSKGTTILAEFNSKDADLAILAYKCLHKTPPLHVTFSHTVRNRTHTFLIDNPIIYFAIYDQKLENSEALIFLTNVKQAFDKMILIDGDVISIQNLNSHRFQGEFNPVFHQLMASQEDLEGCPNSPPMEIIDIRQSDSLDSPRGKRIGSVPLLGGGGEVSKSLKKKKKKKKTFSDESSSSNGGSKDGPGSGHGGILSREISMSVTAANGFFEESPKHRARRVWKRHVWVVLSLDLIVCCVLFGVWLWICRGFKCIDG